jgi:GT2 family glycosyltransferase
MTNADVTVVVVPRDHFSYATDSLLSLYNNADVPFELIYVDGGSPARTAKFIKQYSVEKRFRLLRTEHYLSPNAAKNLTLPYLKTKYVVFVDNDVFFKKDWLGRLVACAEGTGAAVVTPLVLESFDRPGDEHVHYAGGACHISEVDGQRALTNVMYHACEDARTVAAELKRGPTEYTEYHCFLVRRSVLDHLGPFDSGMLNSHEHVDFCLSVARAGEYIYLEPASVVTFIHGLWLSWADIRYYCFRWNDDWESATINHLRGKWNLAGDKYFNERLKNVGWRRRELVLRYFRFVTRRFRIGPLERWLVKTEKTVNRYYTQRYLVRHPFSQP